MLLKFQEGISEGQIKKDHLTERRIPLRERKDGGDIPAVKIQNN